MKNLLVGLIAVVLLVGVQSQANASIIINAGDTIRLYDGPGLANGGEFRVKKNNSNPADWGNTSFLFNTFCAELTETMSFNTSYRVNALNTETVASAKTLTAGTASLFRAYWDGMVSNAESVTIGNGFNSATYSFLNDRANDARSLQLAIWSSLGFNISGQANYNSSNLINTAIKSKADTWIAHATSINLDPSKNTDLLGVRVMNLTNLNAPYTQKVQDQLTVVAPEPGSFLIWTFVAGIGSVVSRRRKAIR